MSFAQIEQYVPRNVEFPVDGLTLSGLTVTKQERQKQIQTYLDVLARDDSKIVERTDPNGRGSFRISTSSKGTTLFTM